MSALTPSTVAAAIVRGVGGRWLWTGFGQSVLGNDFLFPMAKSARIHWTCSADVGFGHYQSIILIVSMDRD